jgi:exosortase D (VPLPA-CTERM-specific)
LRRAAVLWAPILFLGFMIPLPSFLYNNLSNDLQLLSSAVGVAVIRAFGIPVFLEGNVIDLGVYQLQVAEACSGLRYLFPLMSFGFFCAFLYRGAAWKRIALFLSTIPIAILMNSLRIGIIGALVEYQGIAAAQGFLHLFEGWAVFVLCLAILFSQALVLHRLPPRGGAFRETFVMDLPLRQLSSLRLPPLRRQMPLMAVTGILGVTALASLFFTGRTEIPPGRESFASFPLALDGWQGRERALAPEILQALKLDDYIDVDFTDTRTGDLVNFYVAYYASQRKGASAHSPASCIPGGGWEIEDLRTVRIEGAGSEGAGLPVNRVIISKGNARELVYYWFQQRGRILTNEYLVKWYLLLDAITRNRTDGALVRLVTPLQQGADLAKADEMLAGFIRKIEPNLRDYIPD